MTFLDEEYEDEEEDILLFGLPYPLFGGVKVKKNDFAQGLQKTPAGFAMRRKNEKAMLAHIAQNNTKQTKKT